MGGTRAVDPCVLGAAAAADHADVSSMLLPCAAVVIQNKKWVNINDPKLVEKNLRFAESLARANGDTDRIEAFDLAAAAFPNPTPLVAATYVRYECCVATCRGADACSTALCDRCRVAWRHVVTVVMPRRCTRWLCAADRG